MAIRAAAEMRDATAVPLLVERLEDEDDAVRFYAILALDRMTGQRFGYDYAQPTERRARAVERWREYVRLGLHVAPLASATQPADAGEGATSVARPDRESRP